MGIESESASESLSSFSPSCGKYRSAIARACCRSSSGRSICQSNSTNNSNVIITIINKNHNHTHGQINAVNIIIDINEIANNSTFTAIVTSLSYLILQLLHRKDAVLLLEHPQPVSR